MSFTPKNLHNTNEIKTTGGSPYAVYAPYTNALISQFYSLPHIRESSFSDTAEQNEIIDEGGDAYNVEGGKEVSTIQMSFMQQGIDTRDLHKYLKDQRLVIIKEVAKSTINGKKQLLVLPYTKIQPTNEGTSEGITQFTFSNEPLAGSSLALNLASATALIPFHNTFTCANYAVAQGEKYVYIEE